MEPFLLDLENVPIPHFQSTIFFTEMAKFPDDQIKMVRNGSDTQLEHVPKCIRLLYVKQVCNVLAICNILYFYSKVH